MFEFKKFLIESEIYYDPDRIWIKGRNNFDLTSQMLVFIFEPKENKLYYKNGNETHGELYYSEFSEMVRRKLRQKKGIYDSHCLMEIGYLLGRIGIYDNKRIISFWNNEIIKNDLQKCINKLIEENMITSKDWISTPELGTIPIETATNSKRKILTHEELKDLQTRMQLHLMNPIAKRTELQNMGVKPKQDTWKNALQKTGIYNQLWRNTSEQKGGFYV